MDVLVTIEEQSDHSPVLAYVSSIPAPPDCSECPSRDVVTLYGAPSLESLALALAAAVESHRGETGARVEAIRQFGVWPERGAIGDAAWRNSSGELVKQDLEIPIERLRLTAAQLLTECGQLIRRVFAGLLVSDWPEGAGRGITVSLGPIVGLTSPVFAPLEAVIERLREADSFAFEFDGD